MVKLDTHQSCASPQWGLASLSRSGSNNLHLGQEQLTMPWPSAHSIGGVTMCPLFSVWLRHDHYQFTGSVVACSCCFLSLFLEGHVTRNRQWIYYI